MEEECYTKYDIREAIREYYDVMDSINEWAIEAFNFVSSNILISGILVLISGAAINRFLKMDFENKFSCVCLLLIVIAGLTDQPFLAFSWSILCILSLIYTVNSLKKEIVYLKKEIVYLKQLKE